MTNRWRYASILVFVALVMSARLPAQVQLRYQSSLSLSAGAYAASGFGTNHYLGARYNYFFFKGRYFVEAAIGFSSLKSEVLKSISKSQIFESERLYSYEFVFAYDPSPSGYFPYVVGGVAGINQSGQTTFAGVIGLGKRIPLAGFLGTDQLGLRYDVRDQIFSQKINNADEFTAHNIVFSLGMQFYF